MNAPSRLLLQDAPISGEVARSYYRPEHKPDCIGGWFLKAAHEPHADGARLLIEERLGFDRYGAAELAMPSPREWKRADTWQRLEWLKSWAVAEISAAQNNAIRLVDGGPVSTIGD